MLLSGNVQFIPSLPEWKQRALRQSKLGACTKVFVKFADDVRPFWDAKQTILYADSEVVNGSSSTDQYVCLRDPSAAVRYAHKRGDRYTRGYYTVRFFTTLMF